MIPLLSRLTRSASGPAALGALVALSAALPEALAARPHGLELALEVRGEHRIVTAIYASGLPAANADVVVRAPATEGEPVGGGAIWQEGRTDPRGRFIFAPEVSGEWQVVVDDGQGHRATLSVDVAAPAAESQAGDRSRPPEDPDVALEAAASPEARSTDPAGEPIGGRFWQLMAGLGLIAGLTGAAYGLAARR